MILAFSRERLARGIIAAVAVCSAVVIVSFLEFHQWFYNNELPAYIRWGLIGQDDAALQAFYTAAREACGLYRPTRVHDCEDYQLGLLTNGPFVRPVATMAAGAVTALAPIAGFMQTLKFSIIWLGIGGALLVGLVAAPLLLRLPAIGLATVAATWIGGWVATRLLQPAVLGVALPALLTIGLLAGLACAAAGMRLPFAMATLRSSVFAGQPGLAATLGPLYRALGVIACFAIGYAVHQLFRSSYPALYLLLSLGLWLLLWRGLPALGGWTCGLLAGAVYIASASMPFPQMVYLPKGQEAFLVGAAIAVAIFRDDTRIYRALPLVLLFDMQTAARLCALIIVAEGLTAVFRGKGFGAIVPAAVTAVAAVLIMVVTTVYAQQDNLFDPRVAAAVLASPAVVVSAVAAIALIWSGAERSRETPMVVAVDRLLIYAASIVVMAGLAIVAYRQSFYAFRLGTMFREMAPAPGVAVIAGTAALMLCSRRETADIASRRTMIAGLASLLLLMTSIRGPGAGVTQFAEGVRAGFSSYLPPVWEQLWPQMSLDDNVVYLDARNPTSSPLMQYSLIKTLLLAKAERKPDIAVFGQPR